MEEITPNTKDEEKQKQVTGDSAAKLSVDVSFIDTLEKWLEKLPFPIYDYSKEVATVMEEMILHLDDMRFKDALSAAIDLASIWANACNKFDVINFSECMDLLAVDVIHIFDNGSKAVTKSIRYIHAVCTILSGMRYHSSTSNSKAVSRYHIIVTHAEEMWYVVEPEVRQLLPCSEPDFD